MYMLALMLACTPQEQQVARDDGAQIAANVARCVATQATAQGATAEGVALACGLAEIPDALRLLIDEIRAAQGAQKDAGSP